ncbi:YlbF family regulator [Streptococcus caprae]|uniref:YlbF family regulator n=1 Tax=Streptococcus caprae TaxID=1640501 RepID=A0ABV8CT08_9STRE
MLKIDASLFELDEAIDQIVLALKAEPEVQAYLGAKAELEADDVLVQEILDFGQAKEAYQAIEEFASFRPEVRQQRRELLSRKRELDLNDKVVCFRQAEVDLQRRLAELTEQLVSSVSETIFVDTGLPLTARRPNHHKGGTSIREANEIKNEERYV